MANNGRMILKLKKTVAFVGMMGAGKTAVGRAVAEKLQVQFIDSDSEIEKAANMSVAEIFIRDGEKFFRDREAQVIQRLFENSSCIISTGGGAFVSSQVRDILSENGVSLWLKADLDLLWSRVKNKGSRPLLKSNDPFGTLRDIYEARKATYALANITIEADKDFSINAMADHVIDVLSARNDILEVVDGA